MKKVISLLLAVMMLAAFAVSAMAAPDSPQRPGSNMVVIPADRRDADGNPNVGIVKTEDGKIVLQNSDGEISKELHVVLDVNNNQSFLVGGYNNGTIGHIDNVLDPVIKVTFVNSAINANKKNTDGPTETNVGFKTNQLQIDVYNLYEEIVMEKGESIEAFLDKLNDKEAAAFSALLEKKGKKAEDFIVADFFEITLNAAAKKLLEGETEAVISVEVSLNLNVKVGDKVIFGHLQNPGTDSQELSYFEGEVVAVSDAKSTDNGTAHNAPAPKMVEVRFEVDLMNTGVFMVFTEKDALNGSETDEEDSTSPKTGDLGETPVKRDFSWMLVVAVCLAAGFCAVRMGKKEQ